MPPKFADWFPSLNEPVTNAMVASAERVLGLKLPPSYIGLLKIHNGGFLERNVFTNVEGYSEITNRGFFGIYGIGSGDTSGIDCLVADDKTLNQYLIEQWSYPAMSLVFGHPAHGGFALDYSACGPSGEPSVIYTDAECYPDVRHFKVAPEFAAFLSALEEYDPT